MDGQRVERNGIWKERPCTCEIGAWMVRKWKGMETGKRGHMRVRERVRVYVCERARVRVRVCVRARACVRVCVSTRAERADAHSAVGTVCCCVRDSGWSDRVDGQIVEWNGNRKGIWQIAPRQYIRPLSAR